MRCPLAVVYIFLFARVSDETIFVEQETRLQGLHAGGTLGRNRDYWDFGWLAFTCRSIGSRSSQENAMHEPLETVGLGITYFS